MNLSGAGLMDRITAVLWSMSRPRLPLELLVLRPGYVEALSWLDGPARDSGATLPQLLGDRWPRLGRTRKAASVRLLHRLRRLEALRVVRFARFPPEATVERDQARGSKLGRPPSGKWVLTESGKEFQGARLSLELAKKFGREIGSVKPGRVHVPHMGTPVVLLVNIEPVREDFVGLDRMLRGPAIGLVKPATAVALQEWARNSRIIPDWKALQTLRAKHPRDSTGEYSIPEMLALKPWHPAVRRAHRRAETHHLLIVLDLNPAYWDNLPIEELERLRREYLAARGRRDRAFARARITRHQSLVLP